MQSGILLHSVLRLLRQAAVSDRPFRQVMQSWLGCMPAQIVDAHFELQSEPALHAHAVTSASVRPFLLLSSQHWKQSLAAIAEQSPPVEPAEPPEELPPEDVPPEDVPPEDVPPDALPAEPPALEPALPPASDGPSEPPLDELAHAARRPTETRPRPTNNFATFFMMFSLTKAKPHSRAHPGVGSALGSEICPAFGGTRGVGQA